MSVMYRSCFVFIMGTLCRVGESVFLCGIITLDTCGITLFHALLVCCF